MSSMLRSASRKTKCFAQISAKTIGRGSHRCVAKSRVSSFVELSGKADEISKFGSSERDFPSKWISQPLPAVAYDWDDDVNDTDSHEGDTAAILTTKGGLTSQEVIQNFSKTEGDVTRHGALISAVGGRGPPSPGPSKPYPAPSTAGRNGKPISRKSGGGGGGGGRHRCPKCGTYTIFSHNEFGNSFYCATCSGWFTAAETLEGDNNLVKVRKDSASTYEDFLDDKRKEDHNVLMKHVRTIWPNKVYRSYPIGRLYRSFQREDPTIFF